MATCDPGSAGLAARRRRLTESWEALVRRRNRVDPAWDNGIVERFVHPVVTDRHVPLDWRYDFDPERNPRLLERLGVNATFNPGAIELDGRVALVVRVEGVDRKSFFAVAESRSGVDGFRFRPEPVMLPEAGEPATNVYDMRVVRHEDGWIYGVFCVERRDPAAAPGDLSSAIAQCGLARTHDLVTWERLPDLSTPAPQQRNIVLHPEFVDGKYAFYTRPQDLFMEAGTGEGIGWALVADITRPVIERETLLDERGYHTIKELKNGLGPPPIKTDAGWLHLAHGVRNTAAGMRYVLYLFLADQADPWRVTARPGGYFLAPRRQERVGDVSNVLFSNGWVARSDGTVLIYYASSDTRVHVARSTVDVLLDYVRNTPPDSVRSAGAVWQRLELIRANRGAAAAAAEPSAPASRRRRR